MNDIELKNIGNKYFAARKYDEAIRCYSEAIVKKPGVPIYYTNRALCHIKCRHYDRVCQDCRAALEIDPLQVKAHFFLGQALLENQSYDESIRHFQRAQDLAKEQKVNYGDEIAALIRVARKRRFNLAEEARVSQEIELQTYLNQLILEDRERQLSKSKAGSHRPFSHRNPLQQEDTSTPSRGRDYISTDVLEPAQDYKENKQPHSNNELAEEGIQDIVEPKQQQQHPLSSRADVYSDHYNSSEPQPTSEQIYKKAEDRLMDLNQMFAKLDERRRKREVPDYLCGKISFDILHEPVVAPSGITYDRKDIEEHLQRVGHFDPITRTKLTMDLLVPNLAIKEVVDNFLEENEWALDY